ncbi:hypothetical protein FRB99_005191 [Tulasnella sp. 403]|nr:hypothetical protein FRB99_005191 [Tulasnella sp. 403]
MFYGHPTLTTQYALTSFRDTLTAADARWDELRRIPYSTPGRWVISLDISTITTPTTKARLAIDTALTQIFPVTPFLAELSLHPTNILSRRALKSLKESCGMRLRSIKGLGIRDVDPFLSATAREDPVTDLLTCTPNLEVLHVVGQGFADIDDEQPDQQTTTTGTPPVLSLSLEHLHELSLIATPISQVFITLLDTPLPALRSLTLTSYHSEAVDEQILAAQALGLPVPDGGPGLIGGFPGPQPTFPIPATNNGTNDPSTPSFTSLFLKTHGQGLHKLTLVSAPDWPPMPFTPPRDLLITSPHLFHLFLIMEKNTGSLGSPQLHLDAPPKPHPLRTISLTRPNEALLSSLEVALRTTVTPPKQPMATTAANQNGLTLAQALRATGPSTIYLRGGSRLASPIANTRQTSLFPSLSTVKFTSVRWLKLTSRGALNAGTSGGMRQWKSVLRRYGVRVLDMDNAEA